MTEFPERWARASIGEAATLINGRAFKPTDWGSSGLPIIRIQNLNRPDAAYNYFDGSLDPRHEVQPGELLFAWSGTPGTSFGAHIWSGPRAALNQHIFRVLHSEELLDRRFFREAINNQLDELIRRAHGGAGLAHVTKDKFESIEIPVPSLAEQRRIVAKLEELFSELDAGVAALRRAQRRLARYRQALLQAAVTGELTREWRDIVPIDFIEPSPYPLLDPVNDPNLDLEGAPELPEGWAWKAVRSLGQTQTGSTPPTSNREFYGGSIPFYRPSELDDGENVIQSSITLTEAGLAATRAIPENTVMVTCIGATIGKTGLARRAGATNQQINCLLPAPQHEPRYLFWAFSSPLLQRWIKERANSTTLPILNKSKFDLLPIPTPPQEEQRAILAELDRRLSAADVLEATLQASLRRAERLRQSILERAFRGELVPQDPNDEPAEALLARLKAATPDTPTPRRRGRPPKAASAEPQAPRRRGRPRKTPA